MQVLLEGNPYYLALTFAVSVLHSVFDMLAFKNDIGFWKDKKSVEGLSIKTILINCGCQARRRLVFMPPPRPLVRFACHGRRVKVAAQLRPMLPRTSPPTASAPTAGAPASDSWRPSFRGSRTMWRIVAVSQLLLHCRSRPPRQTAPDTSEGKGRCTVSKQCLSACLPGLLPPDFDRILVTTTCWGVGFLYLPDISYR